MGVKVVLAPGELAASAVRRLEEVVKRDNGGRPLIRLKWKRSMEHHEKPSALRRQRRWFEAWRRARAEATRSATYFSKGRPTPLSPEAAADYSRRVFTLRRFTGFTTLVRREPIDGVGMLSERFLGRPYNRDQCYVERGGWESYPCDACGEVINLDDVFWEEEAPNGAALCDRCHRGLSHPPTR